MHQPNYPLKFQPIFKEKLWGGNRLNTVLYKNSPFENTGESWEISAVKGSESVVINGDLKGKNLHDLCNEVSNELMGTNVNKKFNGEFPLLIKFIDAAIPLSVQVHPDDEMAKKYDSFGKNEMWVILDGGNEGAIYLGFNQNESPESIQNALQNGTLMDKIKTYIPQKNDVFNVKAGTVHAIGENVLLAEIQQTSDITFRLFDFNRKDKDGNLRDLHIAESLQALNYQITPESYLPANDRNQPKLVHNQYFKVNQINIQNTYLANTQNFDSFVIYMNLDGEAKISNANGSISFQKGETVLVPYSAEEFTINGEAELLEIFV